MRVHLAGIIRNMDGLRVAAAAALVLCAAAAAVKAQDYPTKPVHLIVPNGAGSIAQRLARPIAAGMMKDLAQPVIIDLRPGAEGTAGAREVARAPRDGYTLVLGTALSQVIGPLILNDPPFDPIKDFQPVALIANMADVMAIDPAINAAGPADLVTYLKANPGLSYGTGGTATPAHLAGEWFAVKAGVQLVHVPYKSVFDAIGDVMSGQLKLMIYPVPVIKPFIANATVRPIAVVSSKRSPALPGVPTLAETLVPGLDFTSWLGILAPAGTPRPVVDRLNAVVVKAMDSTATKEFLAEQGLEAVGAGPDKFADTIRADYDRWRDVVQSLNLRIQR